MEKVIQYKQIVKELLNEIAEIRIQQSHPIDTQIIMDDERGHYLLYKNGWKGERRIYGGFVHIDITDEGKVWLQHDGTDLLIAQILLDKGIPKSDIVLGFHAPIMRKDTEFAVA